MGALMKLMVALGLDSSDYEKGLKKAGDQTKTQASSFKNTLQGFAKQAAVTAGVLAGVGMAAKAAFDFAKEGAQLQLVENRFDRLAESIGTTSTALMNDLSKATSGLMSDAELMASAADLMSLGLVKTHDQAVRLTSIAGQLGMDMNQLTLTLSNKTTMRFDSLGVAVDGFAEKLENLKKSGLTAEEAFTEAFLQQGEAQIEKVGSIADTTAGKIQTLETAWKNYVDSVKVGVSTSIAPMIDHLSATFVLKTKLNEAVAAGIMTQWESNKVYNQANWTMAATEKAIADLDVQLEQHAAVQKATSEGVHDFTNVITQALTPTTEFTEGIAAAGAQMSGFKATAEDIANATGKMQQKAIDAALAYHDLAAALMGLDAAGAAKMQIEQLTALMESDPENAMVYSSAIRQIAIDAGFASEASYAMADAVGYLSGLTTSGILPAEDFAEAWEIANAVSADGSTSWAELTNALIDAGITTQEEVDKINGIDLGEAIGKTGEFATRLGEVFSYPTSQTWKLSVNVSGTGNLGLLGFLGTGGGSVSFGGSGVSSFDQPGIEGASGLDFIVPPGYPNDSFPIRVQSGEHVQVTPAHQVQGGDSGLQAALSKLDVLPEQIALAVRDAIVMVQG